MVDHSIIYIDYYCNKHDHFFTERLVDVKDDNGELIKDDDDNYVKELIKVKLSLRDNNGEKMYLKINYDQGTSQVWTKNSQTPRHTINNVIIPDYNNRKLIINKIKTLITFS